MNNVKSVGDKIRKCQSKLLDDKEKQELEKDKLWLYNEAKYILREIYITLEGRTKLGCGLKEEESIFCKINKFQQISKILDEISRISNIEIVSIDNQFVTVKTKITNSKYVEYDFKDIFLKSQEKNIFWNAFIDAIAENFIKEVVSELSKRKNNIYGIKECEKLMIKKSHFKLCNTSISYNYLNSLQIVELENAANDKISYGEIKVSLNPIGCVEVLIKKVPLKTVSNPLSDYKNFWTKFEIIDPLLQKIFDEIICGIKFLDPIIHIKTLTSHKKLVFYIEGTKYDWEELKSNFDGSVHVKSFIDQINNKICGVKVTSFSFERETINFNSTIRPYVGVNERIEFCIVEDKSSQDTYGKKNFCYNEICLIDFIEEIKKYKKEYFVKQLTQKILLRIEELINDGSFCIVENEYTETQDEDFFSVCLDGIFIDKEVNLSKIEDLNFISQIELGVKSQINELEIFDIKLKKFKIKW